MRQIRNLVIAVGAAALLSGCQLFYDSPPEASDKAINSVLLDAATISGKSQNYFAAVTYYKALYARNPSDERTVLGLATNLRRIGATREAITLLRSVVTRMPGRPALLSELGKAQLAAGHPEDAANALALSLSLGSDDWRAHSAFGVAQDMLGDYAAAQQSYHRALALSPGEPSVLNNMALSLALAGKIDNGIGILEQLSSKPAAGVQSRQNLALLYAMAGHPDRAAQLAERDLSPTDASHNQRLYRQIAANRPATPDSR